jgi:hypothetical protein
MQTVKIFHVTKTANTDSIRQGGLRLGTSWFDRPPSVYFVTEPEDAYMLARDFVYGDSNGERMLVTAEVPATWLIAAQVDHHANEDFEIESAALMQSPVPPEMITSMDYVRAEYQRDGSRRLEFIRSVDLTESIVTSLPDKPCYRCKSEPRMVLTNKKTGKPYYYTYCASCERERKQ